MTKTRIIRTVVLLVFILAVLLISPSGYIRTHSISAARQNANGAYDGADYVFLAETKDAAVDFVINADSICTVIYHVRYNFGIKCYTSPFVRNRHAISTVIGAADLQYDWSSVSMADLYWCIVTKEFNRANDNLDGFEFDYRGTTYVLCYSFGSD